MHEKNHTYNNNIYNSGTNRGNNVRNIYYAEVISIDDNDDGGRIKTRIPQLDDSILNNNLSDCYPIQPTFFWHFPKIGEIVKIFIEDTRYPQKGRHWMGSVISQPHKIFLENKLSALSTTNIATITPETAPSNIPDAAGIYPNKKDIAILGRDNADIILSEKQIEFRAGKHEISNVLRLNKTNPAYFRLNITNDGTVSTSLNVANRIALLTHVGNPKFKTLIDEDELTKIFDTAHPLGRGDVILEIVELLRKAIINHVHPYSGLKPDRSSTISDLENADFTQLLQQNIVIN